MFEQILEEIRQASRIIIHRHSKPDGDALGSQIGLKHIIRENFPEKEVYMVGDEAGRYSFMEDAVMDQIPNEYYDDALAVILDTSSPALISDDRYTRAARSVRMDHHIFCEKIAQVEVTDTSYESCCGLVTEFARESDLRLTPTAAKALYIGMVTDSGRFRYDSTTANTFRLAAFLRQQSFTTEDIYYHLYAEDFESKKRKAQFIMKVQFTDRNVAYIYNTLEECQALEMDTFSISRGMVNTMADIKGVDIWVNFTETEECVLCELRSSRYNINPIAVKYGGGGHAKASGASLKNREEAMAMLADLDAMMGQ